MKCFIKGTVTLWTLYFSQDFFPPMLFESMVQWQNTENGPSYWVDVRTRVSAAANISHLTADVNAKHPPLLLWIVHGVPIFICQRVEIKQVTCRTEEGTNQINQSAV